MTWPQEASRLLDRRGLGRHQRLGGTAGDLSLYLSTRKQRLRHPLELERSSSRGSEKTSAASEPSRFIAHPSVVRAQPLILPS